MALFLNQNVDALRITSRDDSDPKAENLKNQVKDMVEVLGKRNSVTDLKIAVLEAEKALDKTVPVAPPADATPAPTPAAKQPEPPVQQPIDYKGYYEAD